MSPRLLSAAQTPWGRVAIALLSWPVFSLGFGSMAPLFAAAIGLSSFRPELRRSILSSLAVLVCLLDIGPKGFGPEERVPMRVLLIAVTWMAGLIAWTRLFPRLPRAISRHSLLILHVCAVALCAAWWTLRGTGHLGDATAAALSGLVPQLLWRSSYWIKWRAKEKGPAAVWNNLFAALPFIGLGGVPFGKGPGYFAKHEVKKAAELAASQLEGVRLLALSVIWRLADAALARLLWSEKGWAPAWAGLPAPLLPDFSALLHSPAAFALWQRWAGLYAELAHNVLELALYGHALVAVFCLVGFRIPRNTDAPLFATTVVDFWNRYYFYFKELLMDFFFFPAFLKTAGQPVLLRTIAATAAAAFFGNFYYHVVLYTPILYTNGANVYLSTIAARVIYCALLAGGLCVSFARSIGPPKQAAPLRRALQMLAASSFFALIHVWNYAHEPVAVAERWELWNSLLPWNY